MGYTYDAATHTYRDAAGQAVPPQQIRDAVDAVADQAGAEARAAGDAFAAGQVDAAEYTLRVRALVKQAHAAAVAAGAGGWKQTTAADWSEAGQRTKDAYAALNALLVQYHNAEISGPQLAARVAMLPKRARGAYEAVRAGREQQAGYAEERRTLGKNDNHCDGCIEQAARGWVATGELLPIGDCECGGNCLCSVKRRKAAKPKIAAKPKAPTPAPAQPAAFVPLPSPVAAKPKPVPPPQPTPALSVAPKPAAPKPPAPQPPQPKPVPPPPLTPTAPAAFATPVGPKPPKPKPAPPPQPEPVAPAPTPTPTAPAAFLSWPETEDGADAADKWARAATKAWGKLLTIEQKKAIEHYGARHYQAMNGLLRGRAWDDLKARNVVHYGYDEADAKDDIRHITAAIHKSTIPEPTTLWRGIKKGETLGLGDLKDLAPGTVIEESGFVSTSINVKKSRVFAGGSANYPTCVLLRVLAPAGTKAAYLNSSGVAEYEEEAEWLLAPGTRYRVVEHATVVEHDGSHLHQMTVEILP